jgi:heptosyltransferase I
LKILILKPSSLGDVIQALPVLRLLKRHRPSARIHWWINTELAPLLEGDEDLAGVIRFERRRWRSPWHWDELAATVLSLRSQRFDWVIDLQSLARSGTFAWLANGQLTIGLDDAREGARGYYDIAVPRASPLTHAVDWYLDVLRRLGVPVERDFDWLPRRAAVAGAVQARWQTDGKRWVLLNPGARWLNKRWPVEAFVALAQELARRHPALHFAVMGGRDETGLGSRIAAAVPGRTEDLTGRTSLLEMIEWVRLSEVMVTNDTGPMHVAAAMGKPLVGIFGPTHPRRTGPYGMLADVLQNSALPCVPCLKSHCVHPQPLECLHSITVPQVLAEVERKLAAAAG